MKNYPAKVASIFAITWFIDLLDATILNVALPKIAIFFGTTAVYAEWAIVGFLLAFTCALAVSGWLGDQFGPKKVFLLGQILYFFSSLACGFSWSISSLIFFRILQGIGGGMITPVGGALIVRNIPKIHWAKFNSRINMVSLVAPAIGPVFAGYVTTILSWRWLFFLKIPVLLFCIFLSFLWIREEKHEKKPFDWMGFALTILFLSSFLFALTNFGERGMGLKDGIFFLVFSIIFFVAWFFWERRAKHPLIPFSLFRYPLFSTGNVIQSLTNIIYLGTFFIMAFFFQHALNKSIIETGWILSSVTPGMLLILPFISRYYNRLGPTPFIILGLILLSSSMFALCFVSMGISSYLLAGIIFVEGMANSLIQSSNVLAIFSEISKAEMSTASSLYNLFKQVSGAFGVAFSTMCLTFFLWMGNIPPIAKAISTQLLAPFRFTFAILGLIPICALLFLLKFYQGHKALKAIEEDGGFNGS